MTINLKGVITSGLVAGIIISISAITMVPVVGNEMDTVLANHGLPPLSNLDMVYFCFVSLIYGISLIFLYAALKPQFKSKTKTIIITSLIVWILANVIGNVANVVYGFMPVKLTVIGIIWGLMEFLLGTLVASRLYERNSKKDNQ